VINPGAWPRPSPPATPHSSVRYQTPFGGFKQSGLGRELGPDALGAFTETKNVFVATD
jgi:acyl-CoA reductase-like NAD-dependent aldehyde dehydrogenase